MSDTNNQGVPLPSEAQLNYLWNEYKYRHGLCWQAVYKIVAVVTVLGVLPYTKPDLTKLLGYWMLVSPAIGTLFAAFGILVVNNELKLFAQAKVAHHNLQNRFLSGVLTTDVLDFAKHEMSPSEARWTRFDYYVHGLIIVLLLFSLWNILFLAASWIPNHAA
jgi:cytochrome bd-type quinol oxidase subunit 1